MNKIVKIIGAGLAGCEAAYQLAKRGVKVKLYDIKPQKFTPAHHNPKFGELVCSNSLKSNQLSTAGGLLKEELRVLDSLIIKIADECAVPAGSALAVDREIFADKIHEYITNCENIEVVCDEVSTWQNDELTIIATGPLTTESLSNTMSEKLGLNLHFYDAEAPIIAGDSIDYSLTFTADRYGKGESDYVNCPMNKEEYTAFYEALVSAECAVLKNFEKKEIFEGCMPIEVMAKRGFETLCFGPLRPVGFRYPDGKRPFAVVQLRRENARGDMFNIVGFQTNLLFGEQKRVFSLIPALKNAEFLRYGVMHRNTFLNAPEVIDKHFNVKKYPLLFVAGQISGVEGYVESIMSGLVCGINCANLLDDKPFVDYPVTTIIGALSEYLQTPNTNFQPMNANFGILPDLGVRVKDKTAKKLMYSERSLKDLKNLII
jgi:methylenetetrahydrofolate--tRNA-(uracil-5-)-methyltransferase